MLAELFDPFPTFSSTAIFRINLIGLYSACLTLLLGAKLDSRSSNSVKILPETGSTALQRAIEAFHRFALMTSQRLPAASKTSDYCVADIKRLRQKISPLSEPDVPATQNYNLIAPAQTEPWYFAGYDWVSLDAPKLLAGLSANGKSVESFRCSNARFW